MFTGRSTGSGTFEFYAGYQIGVLGGVVPFCVVNWGIESGLVIVSLV